MIEYTDDLQSWTPLLTKVVGIVDLTQLDPQSLLPSDQKLNHTAHYYHSSHHSYYSHPQCPPAPSQESPLNER